ncbi:MAG: hypothetical protein ACI4C1_03130 [Lachnospiraceae bacterium]
MGNIVLLLGLAIFARIKPEYRKKNFLEAVGNWLGDWTNVLLNKSRMSWYQTGKKKEINTLKALYPSESVEDKWRERNQNRWSLVWGVLLSGSLLGFFGSVQNNDLVSLSRNELIRPEFQEGSSKVEVQVDYGEQTEKITVNIEEQKPDEEQVQVLLDDAFQNLCSEILNENSSFDEVRGNLDLPTEDSAGVKAVWKSLSPEWINDRGQIVAETIPESGVVATMEVTLSYQTQKAIYQLSMQLFPEEKNWNWLQKQIENSILAQNESEGEVIILPEEIEGITLQWSPVSDYTWQIVAVLLPILAGMLFVLQSKQLEEVYKKRTEQMNRDYCHIVTVMAMLLSGGMTVRGAWRQVVVNYETDREKGYEMKYAYEEMKLTLMQLGNGVSESQAYHQFGQRCKSYRYMRFSHLLEQGLKQGSLNMENLLEEEAMRALEERKNEALKKGEMLETTMLIPMFFMLGIVLVVLMVPAFMSF